MPVGPAVSFPDIADLASSPPSLDASQVAVAAAGADVPGDTSPGAEAPSMPSTAALSAEEAGWGGNGGVVAAGVGREPVAGRSGGGGGMTAKERARNVALSVACRRCLSCQMLYDLVSWSVSPWKATWLAAGGSDGGGGGGGHVVVVGVGADDGVLVSSACVGVMCCSWCWCMNYSVAMNTSAVG